MAVGFGRSHVSSLAARLVATTVVVVVFAVTIISTTALAGVYELARDQVSERHRTLVDVISTEIATRLNGASREVERTAESVPSTGPASFDRDAFLKEYEDGVAQVDKLVLVLDGDPVGILPRFEPPSFLAGVESTVSIPVSREITFFSETLPNETIAIWATMDAGDGLQVYARLRSRLLAETVARASSEEQARVAIVLDGEGRVIAQGNGGQDVLLSTAEYEHDDSTGGVVSLQTVDGTELAGRYADTDPDAGAAWRVLVVEPETTMRDATFGALVPAVLALIFTGLVSVSIATIAGRRLIRPLKDLESRAYEGAMGAYVRPIRTERADEVGRLAEAFNLIALRLNSLHDLSQLLASSSHLDQVLDGILSAMSHLAGTGSVAIYLFDEKGAVLRTARARGMLRHTAQSLVDHEGGWLVDAARASGPTSFSGLTPDLVEALGVSGSSGPVTCMTAPLVVADDVVGVVLVVLSDRRSMSQAEMEMVRTFSAQAAIAVYNSRLFAEESASRREAELMRTVVEHLARPGDLTSALESVSHIACELLDGMSCTLALLDPPQFGLEVSVTPAKRVLIALWRDSATRADETTTITLGQDQRADSLLGLYGAGRMELVPVVRSRGPAGVFCLFRRFDEGAMEHHERALAAAVAQQVALALENAFYFQQARSRAADLETVFRISQAVSSSLQIKVVLNRVLDVVQKIFSADAVALMTYDESRKRLTTAMARGAISSGLLHYDQPTGQDVIGLVFDSRDPTRIDALGIVEDEIACDAASGGLRSL
ncbi:MAG: GAF domain-containing protein, partial [Actinomycetota bacterium]|nr:GAF domain-containing protein [Actinomycetota bacterium]